MRNKCKKIVKGTIQFGRKIDITDPCYNRDVWCRINDVEIVPGEYTCIAWVKDEGDWGDRVATAGIFLNGVIPKVKDMKPFGEGIGVDAGMAGFFENKADFDDNEWGQFCNLCKDYPTVVLEDSMLFKGFVTSSGYGDGGYPVYAAYNDLGEIVALELRFL